MWGAKLHHTKKVLGVLTILFGLYGAKELVAGSTNEALDALVIAALSGLGLLALIKTTPRKRTGDLRAAESADPLRQLDRRGD
jgi:hypothetical protein